MGYWEGIFYLATQDVKNARWKNLFVLVMVLYIALFTISPLIEMFNHKTASDMYLLDFLILAVFSTLGITATHMYAFGHGKRDLLAERMKYLRSLPIKIEQIVLSRIYGVSLYTLLVIIIYYMVLAISMNVLDVPFSLLTITVHGLQLLVVSLILNVLFLYCELVLTLKTYNIICWVLSFVMLAVILTSSVFLKFSPLFFMLQLAEKSPYIVIVICIAILAIIFYGASKIITAKFRRRTL